MKNTLNSLLRDRAVMDSIAADRTEMLQALESIGTESMSTEALEVLRERDDAAQLDVLLEGHTESLASGQDMSGTEAIVLLRGRPVLLVQEGTWQAPSSSEIARWLGNPADAKNPLRQRLPSIARVEIVGDDEHDYVGTGWMLDHDIMITNRHVAELFGVQRGSGIGFRQQPDGTPMRVRADFKREHQRQDIAQVGVQEVMYIAPQGDIFPDMALLRLDRGGMALPAPIELDHEPLVLDPANQPTLAVVGYPAEDVRNDAMASRKIFDGIYRVKRLSPGRVMTVWPNGRVMEHDCTTLGGNSGSPIINLVTGRACGLHFAGTYRSRNLAVTAGWLKAQLHELESRRIFLSPVLSATVARPGMAPHVPPNEAAQPRVHPPEHFAGREGYREDFLGSHGDLRVPMPSLNPALSALVEITDELPTGELKYCHFSVIMQRERRLSCCAAVNIDGSKLFNFPRAKDVWFLDGRLDTALQEGEPLYVGNQLDRGHLVRRLDPAWGDTREEAKLAELDTFHFTNCAPQHEALNQRTWLSLEDYILGNANTLNFKASVFSGPIMAATDSAYRGTQLPQAFWKVAVMVNSQTGVLSATGYLLSQAGLLDGTEFVFGPHRTYQVPISLIESKTGLIFDLGLFDPLDATEGTPVREIHGAADLVL